MTDDTALAVEVLKRMGGQDETLSEIHKQTMKTNGRVTGLEMREAAREAVRLDRIERQKAEMEAQALAVKEAADVKEGKRNRKAMIFGAICGLFSGIVGYAFLAVTHLL